jgi:hypothetical protein
MGSLLLVLWFVLVAAVIVCAVMNDKCPPEEKPKGICGLFY